MKYIFLLLFILTFASCNNDPNTETTPAVIDSVAVTDPVTGEMSFARVIVSGSKWNDTLKNGDVLQITYTPSAYTPANYTPAVYSPSKFDTVLFRKGTTVPPVEPPVEPPTGNYRLVYTNSFEKDSDIRNSQTQQAGKGVISYTVFKEGKASFLCIPEKVSSGTRSEIQGVPTPDKGAIEWWSNYSVIVNSNMCSFQAHPHTSGSSGSPYLAHEGGKYVWLNWVMTSQGSTNLRHETGYTIQQNTWQRHRVEYEFGKNGFWKHWIDGKLICSWTGQVGDGSGQYFKFGTNGWGSDALNSRVYIDHVQVWEKI